MPKPARTIAWIFFGFIFGVTYSQPDLLHRLDASGKSDTLKIDLLNDHAFSIARQRPDSAAWYAHEAIRRAKSADDYPKGRLNAHIVLGILDKNRGAFDESVAHYLKALRIAEQLGDVRRESVCLNNLGAVYQEQGNFDKALIYFQRSLKLEEAGGGNETQRSIRLFNIGETYAKMDSLDQAYAFYYNSLLIEQKLGNEDGIFYARLGIGKVDTRTGNYKKAAQALDEAMDIAIRREDHPGQTDVDMAMGELHLAQGNHKAAVTAMNSALHRAKGDGYKGQQMEALDGLARIYRATGDNGAAIEAMDRYRSLEQELTGAAVNSKIGELEKQYEVEKKEREIALLKQIAKDKEQQQRRQILLVLGIAGALGLVVGLILMRRMRRKRPGQARPAETVKTTAPLRNPELHFKAEAGKGDLHILPHHLILIEAADNYCKFFFLENDELKTTLLRTRMKAVEQVLTGQPDFYRCHRSYVVNGRMVREISGASQARKLHLHHLKQDVPVSRTFDTGPLEAMLHGRQA